jgi:glycosyltransferase involved in cell wall biosynthesis
MPAPNKFVKLRSNQLEAAIFSRSTDNMPFKILILTRGYARYRGNLVAGIAAALPANYKVIHSTPHFGDDLWEVDWDKLLVDGGLVTHIKFPQIGVLTFANALIERFLNKKSPVRDSPKPVRMDELSPDMVLIQEFSLPMLKAAFYCYLRGIPCIVCSDLGRDSDWSQFSRITRTVHRAAAFLTTAVVAHTKAAKIPLSRQNRPVCFIPHSVDIRNFPCAYETAHEGPVRFLMVAQYIPRKGQDLLAKAVRVLVDRGVRDFVIRLVGTQDPAWLESVIEKENLKDQMPMLGVLKGEPLFDEFKQADVFVLTSRFDTFAVVVHEAAAFGLPLLISKYAESSALMVSDGVNGHIIDPFDEIALADHLEKLITRPELRHSMGRQSRTIGESLCASKLGAKLATWLVDFNQEFSRKQHHS